MRVAGAEPGPDDELRERIREQLTTGALEPALAEGHGTPPTALLEA